MSDFNDHKTVKIRKEQRCLTCLEKFPKGTTMRHNSGKFEGDMYSYHMCEECHEIMNLEEKLNYHDWRDGIDEGHVLETCRIWKGDDITISKAELIFDLRRELEKAKNGKIIRS